MRSIIAFLLILALLTLMIWANKGGARDFVSLTAVIYILVSVLVSSLLSFSLREISLAFKVLWGRAEATETNCRRAALIFKAMRARSLTFGVLGAFVGGILILTKLEGLSRIGPNVAIASLSLFYGIFLSELIFRPMVETAEKKAVSEG